LRLGPPKSAARAPSPQNLRAMNQTLLTDDQGRPRAPVTKAEQQVSNVFGGSPTPAALAASSEMRRTLGTTLLKVEFNGLPPDATSHRLHQVLSALPYEQGVTVSRSKVKVDYGGLDMMATGKGEAQFRNVEDGERAMAALHDAQTRCLFGKGAAAHCKYDDSLRRRRSTDTSAAAVGQG